MSFKSFISNLPEVKGPGEKKLGFSTKLKWTLIILAAFFIISNIPLFGLSENALSQFEYLSIILGANFGSLMSLGIGPIVTASIVLQLLAGAKLINLDLKSHEGKQFYQGLQKVTAIFFTIFEAAIFVLMRGLEATPGLEFLLIFQLFLGGLIVILMDEVVQKYGFGSGISLFIVGGVAWQLFVRAFSFIGPEKTIQPIGKIPVFIVSLMNGNITESMIAILAILSTILIFLIVVYVQSIKVEIPLSFGRVRGFSIRWPLSFLYTSNIPVILTAALHANLQLFATLAQRATGHATFLGGFNSQGVATSGLSFWVAAPHGGILESMITNSFTWTMLVQSMAYVIFMILGSVMFAVFWMKTSGMDPQTQAQNLASSGMQVPGFRRDPRVIESILERYILPLTIMGGIAVGLLAALADITGALVRGTGILLAVMIIYKIYEDIAQQYAMDSNPIAKKMVGN